jgi:hypothetical protein
MKTLASFGMLLLYLVGVGAADLRAQTNSEAVERERLFQRLRAEVLAQMGQTEITNGVSASNFDNPVIRQIFNQMIVHPSFGLRWDETPPPTVRGSDAMQAVAAFITTNGWNMYTGNFLPGYGMGLDTARTIRGLPWEAIRNRDFKAVTHDGILFVVLAPAGHDSCRGVAYNPRTNTFPRTIDGFKPLAGHWYAWIQGGEDSVPLLQQYEGQRLGEPGSAKPIAPETNTPSSGC